MAGHCEAESGHARRRADEKRPLVVLVGNPNTGKTTIFNRLTGARARVGNYPGITVERRIGELRLERPKGGADSIDLIDLPGAYSLTAQSAEEQIAIMAVLGMGDNPRPDLAVVVVDAGQLVRNLYLVLQLIELEVPVVIALNMIDEVDPAPDADALAALLQLPVVPTCGRSALGLAALRDAIARALSVPPRGAVAVPYSAQLLEDLDSLAMVLPADWPRGRPPSGGRLGRARALALWALLSIDRDDEHGTVTPTLASHCRQLREAAVERDVDLEVIGARYQFLDARVASSITGAPASASGRPSRPDPTTTERIDRVLLHPVWGFAVFLLVMVTTFQALFSWSAPLIAQIENLFAWLQQSVQAQLPSGFVANLVSEGILGGVGNVLVFLPQILLLFLLIGLLEDSGYMARAAYLMDRIMRAVGLHGRAFVPMLSGCACAIPAIMATRTMERRRDRLLTMLVIPLMTCSARLPVYTLIITALFAPRTVFGLLPLQGLLMVFMYLFSTVMALTAASVLGRTVVRGRHMPLILELPPYRLPTLRSVLRQMTQRAWIFLREAGTIIALSTVALWALLSYPAPATGQPLPTRAVATWHTRLPQAEPPAAHATVAELADNGAAVNRWRADKLAGSYGGHLGRAIEPALAPLGFDWKIGVGLIGAFAAREVFVSTMGVIYGIGDAEDANTPLHDKLRDEKKAGGSPAYTPLTGLSLLLFFALACQCMSTLAIVRRETNSWRWPAFLFGYMSVLAWFTSLLVYQGGRALGFA